MTLAELIEEVRQNTDTQLPTAVLATRLNLCMERISRDIGVPERYVTDVNANEPFNLPDEAWSKGLKYAEFYDDSPSLSSTGRQKVIPIYTIREANMLYPRWEEGDFPVKMIIYDRANTSAPVFPVGFESGDTLRLLYHVRPAPMTEDDHEPFAVIEEGERTAGQFDSFHLALSQYVSFQVLLRVSPDISAAFYSDYRETLKMFHALVQQDAFYPKPSERSHDRWYRWP